MSQQERMRWLANIRDGDWLFYEFHLSQVDGSGVSNGAVYTGCGIDAQSPLQPLDMRIKRISDSFAYTRDHMPRCNALNYPDLHRLMVQTWTQFCLGTRPRDEVGKWCVDFGNVIAAAVKGRISPTIDGVQVFSS